MSWTSPRYPVKSFKTGMENASHPQLVSGVEEPTPPFVLALKYLFHPQFHFPRASPCVLATFIARHKQLLSLYARKPETPHQGRQRQEEMEALNQALRQKRKDTQQVLIIYSYISSFLGSRGTPRSFRRPTETGAELSTVLSTRQNQGTPHQLGVTLRPERKPSSQITKPTQARRRNARKHSRPIGTTDLLI